MEQNELKHWGIKGMRWGVRRFQNKDGSLTNAGRKRYDEDEVEEKPKTKEEQKADVLSSRSAKTLYENAHLFSSQELQTAYNRLQLEQNIARMSSAEISKGEKFATDTKVTMDRVSGLLESGSRLYNNVAKIYNSVYGRKNGLELPQLDGGEKPKSMIDKIKEKTEEIRANNEYKKVQREAELSDLRDETDRLNTSNANRSAKKRAATLDQEDAKAANATPTSSITNDSSATSAGQSFANSFDSTPASVVYSDPPRIAGLLPAPKDDD